MKAKFLLVASALGAATFVFGADRVDPSQLPPAVKQSLDTASAGDPVKQITMRTTDGRTVYDIELERKNAPNPQLRIAADGQVLADTTRAIPAQDVLPVSPDGVPAAPFVPTVRLDELPAAAQAAVKKEAAGRPISKITRDTINGREAFAVELKESGRNPRVYIADDGTVLRPTEKPPMLGVGTTFTDTPAQVQRAIRDALGTGGEIVKIDKDQRRGEPATYKVEIKNANGTRHLRISEDGKVTEDTRANERPGKRG
jgi:uncharacterized membrane protein YkoI